MLASNTMLVQQAATQWLLLMYQLLVCTISHVVAHCPVELLAVDLREPVQQIRASSKFVPCSES